MDKKANILFTATFSTPFIREDLKILHLHYNVTEIISSGSGTFVKFLFAIQKVEITFSWFASVYSSVLVFLGKIFGKKSIIIIGGVDVAKIPELNYGIWNSWWRAKLVRYAIIRADLVLAVDETLKQDAIRLAGYDGKNIQILPTGYDPEQWKPGISKENFVLTVANCPDMIRVKIKGIDFLLDVARAMPDTSFLLIGLQKQIAAQLDLPSNLSFLESVQQTELLEVYKRAKVFFQSSLREGLPNTLCEAMLCECYPVGTRVGGIPAAIGTTGTIVQHGNVGEATRAIQKGMMQEKNIAARERITLHFSKHKREERLLSFIQSLNDAK